MDIEIFPAEVTEDEIELKEMVTKAVKIMDGCSVDEFISMDKSAEMTRLLPELMMQEKGGRASIEDKKKEEEEEEVETQIDFATALTQTHYKSLPTSKKGWATSHR